MTKTTRFCPICAHSCDRFLPQGLRKRPDARCPSCGSLERHRLVWLYLNKHTDFFDGKKKSVLHVAPEPCLESRFRTAIGSGYVTADLNDPRAKLKIDIEKSGLPSHSFDVIYCSHVLEHVGDDRRALSELQRLLKPNGWAMILVPILGKETFEDPTIVEPSARLAAFGQADHVRRYGPDFVQRLRDARFDVKTIRPSDLAGKEDCERMSLNAAGSIYLCSKRAANAGRSPGTVPRPSPRHR